MRDVLWKSQFPQVYQKLRQIPLARNLPFAQWMYLALENNLCKSNDYLRWAQKYYGLAVLEDRFFREHFTSSVYEEYKNQFLWGPQAYPILKWDGVVFVACLDPHSVPSDLDFPCRPLLATYENLKWGWEHLQSGDQTPDMNHLTEVSVQPLMEEESIAPFIIEEFPRDEETGSEEASLDLSPIDKIDLYRAVELVQSPVENQTEVETSVFNRQNSETLSSIPAPKLTLAPTPDQAPNLAPAPAATPTPAPAPANASGPFDGGALNVALNLPLNTFANGEQNLFNFDEPPPETGSSEDQPDSTGNDAASESEELPDGFGFSMEPPTMSAQTIEEPDLYCHWNATPENRSAEKDQTTLTANAPKIAPPQKAVPTGTDVALQIPPKPGAESSSPSELQSRPMPETELEEELKLCFAKAYQSYRNLMLLKIVGDQALPIRWDESYKKPKDLSPIDLKTPSVFRIASKTQKPFHGQVSPSAVNQQFFQNWLSGQTPTYLTILPLFFDGDCIGLLLGVADASVDRKDSLHLFQSTAQKVESNFGARLAVA